MALRQSAALIRADVGLEAACIDLGGWDTHVNQGGAQGQQARLMTQLAEGLAAFHADMGDAMRHVSVVVMSEFGRRVAENGGGGTDHGHGSALLVMGGNLAQKERRRRMAGLGARRAGPGRRPRHHDRLPRRAGELLTLRLNNAAIADIFPNFTPTPVGLVQA